MPSELVDWFGPAARIHHVGMAVASIDAILPKNEKITDPIQGVSVAFLNAHGLTIELIEPSREQSPVSQSLQKGVKLVHLCYEVPDMEEAIQHAKAHGIRMIARPVPAVAFGGRRIAWLFSTTLGLFELVESQEQRSSFTTSADAVREDPG
jgi:methylmalonyl-CoA/ethylmalonyl-CoA epimerase